MSHIIKAFDAEIRYLNTRISAMGKACEWQLAKAIKALVNLDTRLAQEVVKGDAKINALYTELETDAVNLLAKRTPLANDLRFILATMRIGSQLERIADYAANIARRVLELNQGRVDCGGKDSVFDTAPLVSIDLLQDMGKICRQMINGAVDAFLNLDLTTALDVWHRDDDVDRKFARLMTELRQHMQKESSAVETCTCLICMGRYLERIGDHVTNISEAIYYIETGETYIGTLDS